MTFAAVRVLACIPLAALSLGATSSGRAANCQSLTADTAFSYKFENRRFYIPLIQVNIDAGGNGQLHFMRGESDDVIERKFKILPSTVERIVRLLGVTGFLDSKEEYQAKKDFSHLGWMTITVRQGERERTVRFNYTTNQDIGALAELFNGIATQEIDLFDLELAVQHQPLDVPRMLDALETDLRLERIAEPEQLVARLRELGGDDTMPLIGRNHANRIIKDIEKGKYKQRK
ncbi:MAG TPA: hypothetical protein VN345_16875 [Blastocatellia bacterium]|nr:hypothetical protein [Blastocatellia bacterium]